MSQPPPSDVTAERAVVAACLLSPESLATVRDLLQPEQLFDATCRRILEAIYCLDSAGSRIDIVTLASRMKQAGTLQEIGGTPALAELFDATPDPEHAAEHAEIVAAKHRLRRIIDVCKKHAALAYGDTGQIDEYCAQVERDILEATDSGYTPDAPQTVSELLKEELPKISERQKPDRKREISGTPTGIYELDDKLKGGLDTSLVVLAGRPGMGKTALVLDFLLEVARKGKAVVFFSLEMPKDQLLIRLLAKLSLVSYNTIKSERMTPEEWNAFLKAADTLNKLPFSIQYAPGAHINNIRTTFRREFLRLKRTYDAEPGIAAIDYAQLVRGDRQKGASRDEEIGGISRVCMTFPKEFKCPVVLLSQLNRAVESRPDKRPQMSDLRESGSLEQDGHTIMLVYRDEYYHPETEAKGVAEVIVTKNRNGSTGTVECKFDGPCTRFYSANAQLMDDCDDMALAIGAGDI